MALVDGSLGLHTTVFAGGEKCSGGEEVARKFIQREGWRGEEIGCKY